MRQPLLRMMVCLLYKNAIWATQCTWNISVKHGCGIVAGKKADCPMSPLQYYHIVPKADELISHVRVCQSFLNKDGIILNPNEGKLFTEKIDYLLHVIRPGQLE